MGICEYIYSQMIPEPQGREAKRWRGRRLEQLRYLRDVPAEGLLGSLVESQRRCGKSSCHCAQGTGHAQWSLTFMSGGKKRVVSIPPAWVEEVRRRVEQGRKFKEALCEVFAANAELLTLARRHRRR
jgi:hypothetical protein